MNLRHIRAVALKESREILRDRIYLALAFLVPVLMMVVLGHGLVLEVRHVPMAVWNQDKGPLSRDFVDRFRLSEYFDYRGELTGDQAVEQALKRGDVRFVLIVPPHFSERLSRGLTAPVQTLIDGQFTYHARVASGYVQAITVRFNQDRIQDWLARREGLPPERVQQQLSPVKLEVRYLYNQALKSEWSIAPGLIMLIMLMAPALLTALGVVREKESGSIFNFYASNVRREDFLIGKLLPYVAISAINLLVLTAMALWVYGAPFKGSVSVYAVASLLYIFAAGGIGLLVSVLVRSQAAAALITMLGTMIPGFMFSGLMMPINSMSPEAQREAHLFPAMHDLEVVWGVFLKGQGWDFLWPQVTLIGLYAGVVLTLAWVLFHKRVKR